MATVDPTGAIVAAKPNVALKNSDLGNVSDNIANPGRVANWRKFQCCDLTGALKTIVVASSAPE